MSQPSEFDRWGKTMDNANYFIVVNIDSLSTIFEDLTCSNVLDVRLTKLEMFPSFRR